MHATGQYRYVDPVLISILLICGQRCSRKLEENCTGTIEMMCTWYNRKKIMIITLSLLLKKNWVTSYYGRTWIEALDRNIRLWNIVYSFPWHYQRVILPAACAYFQALRLLFTCRTHRQYSANSEVLIIILATTIIVIWLSQSLTCANRTDEVCLVENQKGNNSEQHSCSSRLSFHSKSANIIIAVHCD